MNQPVFKNRVFESLLTTVKIIGDDPNSHDIKQLEKIEARLNNAIDENPNSLSSVKKHLDELGFLLNDLLLNSNGAESRKWITKLDRQLKSFHDDLIQLVPWINLLPAPEGLEKLHGLDAIPAV